MPERQLSMKRAAGFSSRKNFLYNKYFEEHEFCIFSFAGVHGGLGGDIEGEIQIVALHRGGGKL